LREIAKKNEDFAENEAKIILQDKAQELEKSDESTKKVSLNETRIKKDSKHLKIQVIFFFFHFATA
jgi:hypothetical protein